MAVWGLRRKVRALVKQGRAGEALNLVRSVTDRGTRFTAHHWNLLGVCHAKAGFPEEARKAFEVVLSSNPGSPEALNNQGNLLLLAKRPGEARDYYMKAIGAGVWQVEPRYNLVLAYMDLGHFEKALGAYEDYAAICKVHKSLKAFGLGLAILLVLLLVRG